MALHPTHYTLHKNPLHIKQERKMISVIIPLYNKEASIATALRGVLAQTYQDFEIVVVDDGSTDGGAAVVENYGDPRIRLVRQENAGVSAARNRGIEEAKGEYVAFLDADDEWLPGYLNTQFELTQKFANCDVFVTNYEFHNEDGIVTPTIINNLSFLSEDGVMDNYFKVASSSSPPISTISIMIRIDSIRSIGGFPVGVTLGEDLLTWARLACKYSIAYTKRPLAIYNFRTQKQLVTPRRAPDRDDVVGRELYKLYRCYPSVPYLNTYIALWHKMRMVTYVRLNMKKEADLEFATIRKYMKPDKKVWVWFLLNKLPGKLLRFILFQIAKLR